jgi:hypothetical protein
VQAGEAVSDLTIPTEELEDSISRLEAIFEDHGPVDFDEYDGQMVMEVCRGTRLARPVQRLLITLHQIEQVRRCFPVDHAKAFEEVLPLLEMLREACQDQYKDDL